MLMVEEEERKKDWVQQSELSRACVNLFFLSWSSALMWTTKLQK